MHQNTLSLRIIGFITSLILTFAAYLIIIHPDTFQLGIQRAIFVICTLAILQSIVQYIFFLHLGEDKDSVWNFGTFISTVLLIFIIVFFSIWIMSHLNYNMMPDMGGKVVMPMLPSSNPVLGPS